MMEKRKQSTTSKNIFWKEIEGTNYIYSVSTDGQVMNDITFRVLKPQLDKRIGYLKVNLMIDGKRSSKTIHRLVAKAWIPNPENKAEVNHIDCDRTNNDVHNLEWMTRKENAQHAAKLGRLKYHNHLNGTDHPLSKLTPEDVTQMRFMWKQGFTFTAIAKKFNIHLTTASRICQKKSWKHL